MAEPGGRLKYQKQVSKKEESIDSMKSMEEAFRVADFVKKLQGMTVKGEKGDRGEDAPVVNKREIAKLVLEMVRIPKDGKDGKDAPVIDKQEIIQAIVKLIPPTKHGKDGRDGKDAKLPSLEQLAINTINMLESLTGDDRLDAKAIKNLDKYIRQNWGGPGIIFHDTTLTGSGVPGDPLSVANGAGGGGYTYNEIPTGTVNGSNVTFTLAHVPKQPKLILVVLGGAIQSQLGGSPDYSISGSTITMTSAPVSPATLNVYYS